MSLQPIILLVDDEEDLCDLMSMTLMRMGIRTHSAYNVAQAKQLIMTQNYHACITDMNLPDGNGIELVEFISANFPQLPVAILTAYGNMELAIAALKAGAFDFISKPIQQIELEQLIAKVLKQPVHFNKKIKVLT